MVLYMLLKLMSPIIFEPLNEYLLIHFFHLAPSKNPIQINIIYIYYKRKFTFKANSLVVIKAIVTLLDITGGIIS